MTKSLISIVQGVRKILPDWKADNIFLESGYSINGQQPEERVSIATKLVQYTCKRSCVVRRMRNSPYSAGGAALATSWTNLDNYKMETIKTNQIIQILLL